LVFVVFQGPCLYIRGYDLIADSLRNVFSKYGVVNRVFVEERQKSAFITYATTEEAEVAIKEMDGNMVNGITLRVSFARRQNQCGDSGRFRSGKSFDRNSFGDERGGSGRCNRSWSERNSRFRGDEGDSFDTYKSTVSVKERDDFNTWKSTAVNNKGDDFDTYKPFDNNGKSGSSVTRSRGTINDNARENFGKKHGDFDEHLGSERRHNSSDDRYHSFRGDGRGSRISRRGSRSRGGPSWQPRRRKNESKVVDHCAIRDETGDKNDFWPSSVCHTSAQNKNDSNSRENKLQERATSSHQSSNKSDEPWVVERSGEDQPFRGSTGRNYGNGKRGENRGGGFRRQRRDFDNKSTWPDDEKGKLSGYDEWPDVGSKPSSDSWPTLSDDKMLNSLPPPPPISEVQIAWSEATKKTSKQMAAATKREETAIIQRKPEMRTQVSYAEDDPFA
uniref:Negative elongation factor E n=1 Tax=Onchocerca flexuosa TaxID=387005 RepID=A0A183I1D9_9BILA